MSGDVERRARDWRRAQLTSVCDVVEPWEHGTVMRATRYPSYYDFNVVLVDGDPGMSAEELVAVADERLAGLEHRRLDFELVEAGDRVRGDLEAGQFEATRLLWMRHSGSLPPGPGLEVEEVDYDAIVDLRRAWHAEDFPEVATGDYIANSREVSMTRGVQVIATRDGDELVGYAQVERSGAAAEITHVFVLPEHRGSGRGTAITRAAIEAAGDVDDLWIVADDEDRPKELYGRLGFRPAWTSIEFVRAPGIAGYSP